MYGKRPSDTTTVPQKPISGYQPQVGADRVALTTIAVRTLGNGSNPTNRGQFHYDLRSTTFTGLDQELFSSRVITNESSSKPRKARTTRHTSNCAPNVPKPRSHMDCEVQNNSHLKTEASTPDMICPHTASAMNRQLWLRQVQSAPGAEISSKTNARNSTFRSNRKSAI